MHGEQLIQRGEGGGGAREGYVYRGGVGVGDFRYFYNVNLFL